MKIETIRFLLLAALTSLGVVWMSQFTPAIAAIDQSIATPALEYMMEDTFPDATVLPEILGTCQADRYASASWIWGETGGVVILQQQGNTWRVIGSTGGVYSPSELNSNFDIPIATAERLICD
jgi:hypothetical protein